MGLMNFINILVQGFKKFHTLGLTSELVDTSELVEMITILGLA